jgi:cytidylate kinase
MLDTIRPILASIQSVPVVRRETDPARDTRPAVAPFVTISQEPGAGGTELAERLVAALNVVDPGDRPWTCWDRELVARVAADLHVAEQIIDSLEERDHSWLSEFLAGLTHLSGHDHSSEAEVYSKTATAIRALARAGRTVIVGRGGVFVTRQMPGGVHVRIVAPFDDRVRHTARHLHLSHNDAAARVREQERNRATFFRRYWPTTNLDAATFAATLNGAQIGTDTMVQMLLPLIRDRART